MVDLLELGDVAGADIQIAAASRLAAALHRPLYEWWTSLFRCARAQIDGRFDEAERLAKETLAIGQRGQAENAVHVFAQAMFNIRREQGRLAEVEESIHGFIAMYPAVPAWRCARALMHLELGREDAAREEFESLARAGFDALPRDAQWLIAVTLLAEVCGRLGDGARAEALYAPLAPYAGRNVIVGRAATCNGSASRPLGILAAAQGDWERAERHFADALAMHEAMGARPFAARTHVAWAEMELARGEPAAARARLAEAIVIADALGMRALGARARSLVAGAGVDVAPARAWASPVMVRRVDAGAGERRVSSGCAVAVLCAGAGERRASRGAGSTGPAVTCGRSNVAYEPLSRPTERRGTPRSPSMPAVEVRPARTAHLRRGEPVRPGAYRHSTDAPPDHRLHLLACGHEEPKWHGRCAGCGEWNTLAEERRARRAQPARRRRRAPRPAAARCGRSGSPTSQAVKVARLQTGIGELDRVLGGGLVPGSLVLLGGSPGIGKSTLTSMALGNLAGAGPAHAVRVRRGVGRADQAARRAARPAPRWRCPCSPRPTSTPCSPRSTPSGPRSASSTPCRRCTPADLTGAAGSVGQVREVADRITRLAKARDIAVLLVGHVTKEGALAGPRVLEHLVDCVLQFEGERERTYRTLRALKNRFGSTSEAGVFEMRQGGLVEVQDASARFVGEATRAPGSVVLAAMEGSRPLLVEVQALVSPSELVPPRRVANGIDRNRLALVLAVLGRHAGVGVGSADVFVNVAGGVRVDEPGADLAVALAVASAARGVTAGDGERPIACFGEIGLTGELRSVAHPERRLAEAAKFGLRPVIAPAGAGRGASEAPTLRAALKAALAPRPDRSRRCRVARSNGFDNPVFLALQSRNLG